MSTQPFANSGASLTIIIPAHNEAGYIGTCLSGLLAQDDASGSMHIIISANACRDETVQIARTFIAQFENRGSSLSVLDLPEPGKLLALNAAEAECAQAGVRIYLDADVICDKFLIGQIRHALASDAALYATGTLAISPAKSVITRAYARFWTQLPFVKAGAVGAGFFAVNAAGRARWGIFPDIISDDTFVRLHFSPQERIEVPANYHWPMIEGFSGLVKVRRRQDAGVAELRRRYPELFDNDNTERIGLGRLMGLAIRRPLAFTVYMAVHLAVRTRRASSTWVRGR